MREKGWGRIINVGSLSTARALPNATIYGTAKTGIWGLTRQMAMDFAPWGVTVNALCPGYFETELTAPIVADKARWQALADTTMMGRNGGLPGERRRPLCHRTDALCRWRFYGKIAGAGFPA